MVTDALKMSLMVTGFVFIMLLLIEYVNVATRGMWQDLLKKHNWAQYLIAAILGSIPGCFGAFTVVALYSHNVVSFGALVTAMIATSGDEAFIMFSLFPGQAAILTLILFFVGIMAGYFSDIFTAKKIILKDNSYHELEVHDSKVCISFPRYKIIRQIKDISLQRFLLLALHLIILCALINDLLISDAVNWIKATFTILAFFSLFVVLTVPEHFLEVHLWKHAVKQHVPGLFAWTFGALIILNLITNNIDLETMVNAHINIVLIIALLVGIIPESGPHMLFVTLFANGSIPFSILLANSIVQDGHGMLPMLSISKRKFIILKLINMLVGFCVGIMGLSFLQ